LQAEEYHTNREARVWQHHVVWVLRCRWDWCTLQNRWHHEVGKLWGYIEATSQDISQEVKACSQMGSSKWTITPSILPNGQLPQAYFQMDNDPKHTSKWTMTPSILPNGQ
jgi:hypothetical protein